MRFGRTLLMIIATGLAVQLAAAQEGPPVVKPGPEHEILDRDAGSWDATVEIMVPNAPPAVSKGTETNAWGPGGLWLITDFKSEMMGQPFQGHGVTGYDPAKKKYVGTWVDSMTSSLSISESTYDKATSSMVGWSEAPDLTGKMVRTTGVTEYKDPDTRIFTMSAPGPDGKHNPTMRITYKRRN